MITRLKLGEEVGPSMIFLMILILLFLSLDLYELIKGHFFNLCLFYVSRCLKGRVKYALLLNYSFELLIFLYFLIRRFCVLVKIAEKLSFILFDCFGCPLCFRVSKLSKDFLNFLLRLCVQQFVCLLENV